MFVGLQGSGKTTTVTKLAYHYKKKGWQTALVCADTFRAGAFDQLRMNATKAKIPFYGSETEADPVKVAKEGVDIFKSEKTEIIIVDTSGRHKQEEELFEEMQEISAATDPQNIIFVMDSSIGQAAFDQAKAFKDKVKVGSVIITKMDGHAKGGGALSAVAATESPIVFLGTGEQIPDLEMFDAKSFVSRLLGMGDIPGMMKLIQDVVPPDGEDMAKRLSEGKFSLRDMYKQFQYIQQMGPLSNVLSMIPGMNNLPQMQGDLGTAKLKAYVTIMDSLTDAELDNAKVLDPPRIMRIARGSGRHPAEVRELLEQHKNFEKVFSGPKGKGMAGLMNKGGLNPRSMQQMASLVPPAALKGMGGMGGLQNMLKSMGAGGMKMPEGFPNFPGFGM
eukprot:TRINITY_DN2185_c0_g1_i2.p1 TRINITY_DN2185_c0_g1~~TRINITY_DN2185_c0_g1_i2.p1  ORF type:complete len:434 (+),score=136.23 TRINITY_DN2185_c0_g1_i2:134-1303(+)